MKTQRRLILLAATGLCAAGLCATAFAQTAGATAMPTPKVVAPVVVTLETTAGPIVLELDAQAAPHTVANFVQYVKDGFYSGTIFHRVIPTFMIQGGGFTTDMRQKGTRPPIAIESNNGLKNVVGTIAMARTSNPNSATAQFFINVVDNPNLDYPGMDGAGYTVFGHVVAGMDTVEKIRMAPSKTGPNGAPTSDPVAPVVIKAARLGR
jgi:peptidyl-prolyl cis-trans isomerase A (cyclophilin A)